MANSPAFRIRLREVLDRITPSDNVVGTGGLAILCAASVLVGFPAYNELFPEALRQFLGGMGLNILAGVLQQQYQRLRENPSEDEVAALNRLARGLASEINDHPMLRKEMGTFLEKTKAIEIAEELVKENPAAYSWLLVKIYQELVQYRSEFDQIHLALEQIKELLEQLPSIPSNEPVQSSIPRPHLVVGRRLDIDNIKSRLGLPNDEAKQELTIIRGVPGVGKTTLVTALAKEHDIKNSFPDGILWIALGEHPSPLSQLKALARSLNMRDTERVQSIDELMELLRAQLSQKRILIIVDDIWNVSDAAPFKVAGPQCATIMTTRFTDVARGLSVTPDNIYVLQQLDADAGIELISKVAPTVVLKHPDKSRRLVSELEGLPLALRVAGPLLEIENSLGGIDELLEELAEGNNLLQLDAPDDRYDPKTGTIPTVSILLKKSTDRLSQEDQLFYAILGVFAPKPATFDLDAVQAVWPVGDARPIVRRLVDRGLLEPIIETERLQMHAVLRMHARTLFPR